MAARGSHVTAGPAGSRLVPGAAMAGWFFTPDPPPATAARALQVILQNWAVRCVIDLLAEEASPGTVPKWVLGVLQVHPARTPEPALMDRLGQL